MFEDMKNNVNTKYRGAVKDYLVRLLNRDAFDGAGLIYRMLDLPGELYTPIFAMSRIAGWSAHRIGEIQNSGKIIRPAYINVKENREYRCLADR